jgi:hypothetical protein
MDELFHSALARDARARAIFQHDACGDDTHLLL